MSSANDNQFLLTGFAHRVVQAIRNNLTPLLAAVVFGALAHMFAFTNKLVNYDDVECLFNKGITYLWGRWGLCFMDEIFPNYSMPWIYGVITIILMAISVCLMVQVFEIRSKLLQILLAGTILVFPSLTATVTFLFTLSSYAVSFLLAVLSVWLLRQEWKYPWLRYLGAVACLVGSLSIYQAYLSIAASMLVILLIEELLQGKTVSGVLRRGFRYLAFLAVSMLLYFLSTVVVEKVLGFSGSLDKSHVSLLDLPKNLIASYEWFAAVLLHGRQGLISTGTSKVLHILCLSFSCVLLLIWVFPGIKERQDGRKEGSGRLLLLIILILLLPAAANCLLLLGGEDSLHSLVLYGYVAIYLFCIVVVNACLPLLLNRRFLELIRRVCLNVVTIALAFIIVCNTYIANEVYLNLYLRYENTHAFYTALVADIQATPGFDENTELAVIGFYHWPSYFIHPIGNIMGASGFMPDDYSKDRFLKHYLGFEIPMASQARMDEIAASQEYLDMPVYPYYGCMKMIGNTFVVKLS